MTVRRLLCNVKIVLVKVILLVHYADCMNECPVDDGYVRRGPNCCKTIKCNINENYILCNDGIERGQDQCVPCPNGTVNQDAIDTKEVDYHLEVCRKPDCVCGPEEAKLVNPAECWVTGRKMCECDRDRGFCGHDYMICKRSSKLEDSLEEGIELTQDCTFEPCKPGFFKEKKGLGKCEKHRECPQGFITTFNGSSIKDRECEPDLKAVSNTTVKSNTSDPRNTSESDSSSLETITIIVIIIVCITLACVFICFLYLKRKKLFAGDRSICVSIFQKLTLGFTRTHENEDVEKNNDRKREDEEHSLKSLDPNLRVPADTTSDAPRIGQQDKSQGELQAIVPTGGTLTIECENNQPSMGIRKQNSNNVSTASIAFSSLPDEVGEKMNFSSVLWSKSLPTTSLEIKDNSILHSGKPCAMVQPLIQKEELGVFTSGTDLALSEGNLELDSLLESSPESSESEDDQQTHSKDTFQSL